MNVSTQNGNCDPLESVISLIEKQTLSRADSISGVDEILMMQFLEYAKTHLVALSACNLPTMNFILKDVNDMLSDKVYLVGCEKTLVDEIYYRMIHPAMSKLSFSDKENFIHLSRWFDHLQHDNSVRQSRSLVTFNRTLLYV